jgi:hypothetical protein
LDRVQETASYSHVIVEFQGNDKRLVELSNSPKFILSYSPPTSWTVAPETPTQGQAQNPEAARKNAEKAIENAVRRNLAFLISAWFRWCLGENWK